LDNWNLIAIDDGSTDSSLELIRSVKDSRIQVISDWRSLGLVDRLNQIAAMADTEFLARMDADDIMHPERLAVQCAYLERNLHINLAGSAAYVIDGSGQVMGKRGEQPLDLRPASVLRHGLFIHPTVIGRRRWFLRNPYSADYVRAEDRELWCRTCKTEQFVALTRPLLFYREREDAAAKYCMSCRTHREIIRKYGPEYIGTAGTLSLVCMSRAKEMVYRLSSCVGMERRLVQARNTAISRGEFQYASRVLALMKQTQLPGIGEEHVLASSAAEQSLN
jgi:glycosyltransferase involved in cell wall biosynthesis